MYAEQGCFHFLGYLHLLLTDVVIDLLHSLQNRHCGFVARFKADSIGSSQPWIPAHLADDKPESIGTNARYGPVLEVLVFEALGLALSTFLYAQVVVLLERLLSQDQKR